MGINCHIMIEHPCLSDGSDNNIAIMHAADVRWSLYDAELRETLGIPDRSTKEPFWEHLNNGDYQRVLDAALVHREVLLKRRDLLDLERFNPQHRLSQGDLDFDTNEHDINRTSEWIHYYDIAATLVKLGHTVVCYGA